jgi:ribosome-associated protein
MQRKSLPQEDPPDSGQGEDRPPSKTRRKHEKHALQDLGEALIALDPKRLAQLDLPERLADAIGQARGIRAHEGRRRQLQYVGKLMRTVDPEPIRHALALAAGDSRQAVELMHRCERWRDRLLDDDAALTELLSRYPGIDSQPLRATIRSARRERSAGAAPRHARELYRWLHATLAAAEAGE